MATIIVANSVRLPITIEVTMTNRLRPSKISYVKNFPNKDLDNK